MRGWNSYPQGPPRSGQIELHRESSGQLGRIDSLVQLPGLGIVGVQTTYDDFRDVGGMQLPFRSVAKFASQLVGRVVTTMDKAETGVEVSPEMFAAPTAPNE